MNFLYIFIGIVILIIAILAISLIIPIQKESSSCEDLNEIVDFTKDFKRYDFKNYKNLDSTETKENKARDEYNNFVI